MGFLGGYNWDLGASVETIDQFATIEVKVELDIINVSLDLLTEVTVEIE